MTPARRRPLLLILLLAVVAAAGLAWLLMARDEDRSSLGAQVAARQAKVGECVRERECPGAPESNEDLAKISSSVVSRLGATDGRGSLRRALDQRARLQAK